MSAFVISTVFAVGMLVVLMIPALRRRRLRGSLDRLAQTSGLALTEEVLPSLLRWRRATWVGYAIGVPVGFEAASAVLLALPTSNDPTASLLPSASWLLSGGLGALIGGLIGAHTTRATGSRIARDRRVTLADYVDPLERRVVATTAAVALLAGLPALFQGAIVGIAAAAAGALAVAVAFALAHRTVAAPQRVGSTGALAWDDAIRATTARTMLHAGGIVAMYTLILSIPSALAGTGARDTDLAFRTLIGVSIVLLVPMIWTMRQRPARYFLRRLWPATAAEADANERAAMEVPS